jgi:hypothetical protein
MRTRRTKEQIRKDNYNKDVDAYNFYVVNLDTKRAETGFEFKEDAVDVLNDYDDKKKYKVVSKRALKSMGIENPNESFKYEGGGDLENIASTYGKMLNDLSKEKQFNKKMEKNAIINRYAKQHDITIDNNNIIYIKGERIAYIDKINQKTGQSKSNWEIKKFEFGGDFQSGVYVKGGGINKQIAFRIENDYIGWMQLGFYDIELSDDYNAQGSFFKFTDALNKLFDYLNSEDGLYVSENYPKSVFNVVKLYAGNKKDFRGDTEIIEKTVFKISAKDVLNYKKTDSFKNGGSLIGNQKSIDLNKNGKIDAEDFKLLRTTMNGAWRKDHKYVNSSNPKEDYEVIYARKYKPSRKGYKGKTNFATGGGVDRFSEYSNDALYDMIINLSRYENTESDIQMVKDAIVNKKADEFIKNLKDKGISATKRISKNGIFIYGEKNQYGKYKYETYLSYSEVPNNDFLEIEMSEFLRLHKKMATGGGIDFSKRQSVLAYKDNLRASYFVDKTNDGYKIIRHTGSVLMPFGSNKEKDFKDWFKKNTDSFEILYATGGGIGIQQEIDLTDDKKLRLRKPVMPERKYSEREWAEKFNPRAYEFMGKRKMATGGSLNLDFRNFTLNDLIKNLPQDVDFMWISKINSKDYVRRYNKEFNKYANKKYTISDFGKIELSKGSENLYLDMKVFEASDEAPETEYIISIYTKDNQKGLKEFTNNLVQKFSKGGKTEQGVDLFEDYENIPPKLQAILEKYEDAFEDGDYRGLQKALEEANKIGYTFEYYLDGQAYDLRKIGEKGKSEVEEYANGGGVEKLSFEDWLKKNNIEVYKRTYYWVADDGGNDYMYSGSKGDVMKSLREDYKKSFADGGAFEKLSDKVAKNYEGKRVKPQYQKEYGKVYSKSEAKEVGDKVAGKVKANQKMTTGGATKKGGQGGIMVLAKQIRKDGESWKDALKRAGQQLK